MTLAELQAHFQASVLAEAPAPDFLRRLSPPARAENIEQTFAVYHDGYPLRMAEFLAHDYPILREALGDEDFSALVKAYVSAKPSRWRNARWVGAGLPKFMQATPPYAGSALVCGLAALEAALARAFDSADETPLAVEILGVTPQEDWPRLRFAFHPGVAVIASPAAALAYYEAAQREATPDLEACGEDRLTLLVWREGLDVQYRVLDALEALALREALGGAPFGQICSLLAFSRPEDSPEDLTMAAAGFLLSWFSEGLIVAAGPPSGEILTE
jgi:hypothetical protein